MMDDEIFEKNLDGTLKKKSRRPKKIFRMRPKSRL